MKRSITLVVLLLPLIHNLASGWDLVRVPAPDNPQTLSILGFKLFHRAGDFWIGSAMKQANLPPGSQILHGYDSGTGELFQLIFANPTESAKLVDKVHILYFDENEAIIQATVEQLQSLPVIQGQWIRITTQPKFMGYTGIAVEQTDEFHPLIEEILANVSLDQYTEYMQTLEDFRTRNTFHSNCDSAAFWIYNQFQSFGLDASLHEFEILGYTKYNVIGELPGILYPDSVIFVTGHYDATVGYQMMPEPVAPGADDDGSGTAYVIECARVLSQYQFEKTIRFVAFAGEEQGMVGSLNYVGGLIGSEVQVVGDFNLDMVGYSGEDPLPPDLYIYIDGNPLSLPMAEKVEEAVDTFLPGALEPNVQMNPLMIYSDHSSFWGQGFPAIWGIESVPFGYDFNPFYHTVDDLLIHCDAEYAANCTKAFIAALADYAVPFAVEGPYLTVADQQLSEISGNGNNVPDPGETISLEVTLHNYGTQPATNIEAALSCSDRLITITQGYTAFPDLAAGESAEGIQNYELQIHSSYPANVWVMNDLLITASGGYENTCAISFQVTPPIYEPTGPDAYGYQAYDPNDYPEFPELDWMEICADSGGPGVRVPFTINDQTFNYDLPFTFGYYGTSFDRYTIAANGWIGMGDILEDCSVNYFIPGSGGPPAMIAPYWRDLAPVNPSSGGVWYWFDRNNHRLIVEYNHIEEATLYGIHETFQVILEDPAYNPQSTGDGRIRFQYRDMSNNAQTYGTIGIEDPTETMGLQYFFNAVYNNNATPVADESVILFIPPENPSSVASRPEFTPPSTYRLIGAFPNPFNPTTTIRFDLPIASLVSFEVFEINGCRAGIDLASNRPYPPGMHTITFDGSNFPSGIYIYHLTAGDFTAAGKMVLMK